jgi:Asp-tRNA(Asn)/Glu-tRNA(Gln) amidotransferase A subunit family amidase
MQQAMNDAVERLRAGGVAIDDLDPPEGWAELVEAARTINTYEGARSHREHLSQFGERIGMRLAVLVREGLEMPKEMYDRARAHVERMKVQTRSLFGEYPAVLSPSAPGAAPLGLASTGDPVHNAPWTALGTPAISIPLSTGGPPLGLQVTAAYGRDDALVAMAASAAGLLSRNR